MSAAEKALLARIRNRASGMRPDFNRRLLAAWNVIRRSLSDAEFARSLKSGQVERLVAELASDDMLDPAFAPLRALIDKETLAAAEAWTRDLPLKAENVFDQLNPRVVEAVRALDTRVIDGLKAEVRETVRQAAEAGLEAGQGAKTVARVVRDSIGLGPSQEQQVRNFREALSGERPIGGYTLRNKVVDRMLAKGPLTTEQVDRYTDVYRNARIAQNAESVTRTVALDSQRLAQRNSWVSAIENGAVEQDRLRRKWIAVLDDRTRDEHRFLNGEEVGFDERFSNGELEPGESTYNCRCICRVILLPARRMAA